MVIIIIGSIRIITLKQPSKIINIFTHFEVVSRYRDPQLQVGENYTYFFNFVPNNSDFVDQ